MATSFSGGRSQKKEKKKTTTYNDRKVKEKHWRQNTTQKTKDSTTPARLCKLQKKVHSTRSRK
jgi:hypothetical protein